MRCIGATVILLLVLLYTQDAAAVNRKSLEEICNDKFPPKKCDSHGEGWYKLDAKRCIKLFTSSETWTDAELTCDNKCGHLVSMHNADEYSEVLCLLMRAYPETQQSVWIGGRRQNNGTYGWTDGTKFSFTKWNENQPDFYKKKEICAEMNRFAWGHWNDLHCTAKQPFVCVVMDDLISPFC